MLAGSLHRGVPVAYNLSSIAPGRGWAARIGGARGAPTGHPMASDELGVCRMCRHYPTDRLEGVVERRSLLKWICGVIAAMCSVVVAVPVVRFLLGPLQRRDSLGTLVQRIALLEQVPVNQPKQFAIQGNRRDGWTLHPKVAVGRVWLVRRTDVSVEPEKAQVDAFSAECPHLGCIIGFTESKAQFLCPCHQATFDLTGEIVGKDQTGFENPSPRNMDTIPCRVVHDEKGDRWWVEVEFQKYEKGLAAKVPV